MLVLDVDVFLRSPHLFSEEFLSFHIIMTCPQMFSDTIGVLHYSTAPVKRTSHSNVRKLMLLQNVIEEFLSPFKCWLAFFTCDFNLWTCVCLQFLWNGRIVWFLFRELKLRLRDVLRKDCDLGKSKVSSYDKGGLRSRKRNEGYLRNPSLTISVIERFHRKDLIFFKHWHFNFCKPISRHDRWQAKQQRTHQLV
jgi:hypothetical protein